MAAAAGGTVAIEPAEGAPGPPLMLPAETYQQISDIVQKSGDRRWAVRKILRMGVLTNQRVEYRKFGTSVLTGTMMADGRVQCDCPKCQGKEVITCLAFEEHAGGYLRRPADSMYIINLGLSIRDFCFQGKDNPTDRERAESSSSRKRKSQPKKPPPQAQAHAQHAAFQMQAAQQAVMAQQMVQQLAASLPKGTSKPMAQAPPISGMLDAAQMAHLQQMHAGQHGQVPQQQFLGLAGQPWLPVSGGMVAPMLPGQDSMARKGRNSNKHKRLFSGGPGCPLTHGEEVKYVTAQQEVLLKGTVCLDHHGHSGILCSHCDKVISCSTFESHAGRGARRAPYDNIFNAKGESLRDLAMKVPDEGQPAPSPLMQHGMGMNFALQPNMQGGQLPSPLGMPSVSMMMPSSSAPGSAPMDQNQFLAAQSALVAQMNPHAFQAAMQQVQGQLQPGQHQFMAMPPPGGIPSPGIGPQQPLLPGGMTQPPPQPQ